MLDNLLLEELVGSLHFFLLLIVFFDALVCSSASPCFYSDLFGGDYKSNEPMSIKNSGHTWKKGVNKYKVLFIRTQFLV